MQATVGAPRGDAPRCQRRGTPRFPIVHHNRGGLFLAGHFRTPPITPMLRFRSTPSGPLGDPRSAERWLATLPANDPLVAQRSIVAELRALAERTARRRPSALEAVFSVDAYANVLARNPDGAVHPACGPLRENRGPALAGAVRAGAGIPGVLRGICPRRRRSAPRRQMACAPAGARRAADRLSAPGREAPALSLRALGCGEMERTVRDFHARLRASVRAGAASPHPDGRADDDRARVPDDPAAAPCQSRQSDAEGGRMDRRAA